MNSPNPPSTVRLSLPPTPPPNLPNKPLKNLFHPSRTPKPLHPNPNYNPNLLIKNQENSFGEDWGKLFEGGLEAEEDGRGEVGEGGGGTTEIRPAGREAEERVVVCCGVFVTNNMKEP